MTPLAGLRALKNEIMLFIKTTPKDDEHSLIVMVDDQGVIYSALVYVPHFDEWVDCAELVKDRYRYQVDQAFDEHLEKQKSIQEERRYEHDGE